MPFNERKKYIYALPIVSLDSDHAFAIARTAWLDVALTPILISVICSILVNREDVICELLHTHHLSRMDVECVIVHASALAILARSQCGVVTAAGTVIAAVTCTYRTTHTSVSLRTDHIIQAVNPQNAASMTERMSF